MDFFKYILSFKRGYLDEKSVGLQPLESSGFGFKQSRRSLKQTAVVFGWLLQSEGTKFGRLTVTSRVNSVESRFYVEDLRQQPSFIYMHQLAYSRACPCLCMDFLAGYLLGVVRFALAVSGPLAACCHCGEYHRVMHAPYTRRVIINIITASQQPS